MCVPFKGAKKMKNISCILSMKKSLLAIAATTTIIVFHLPDSKVLAIDFGFTVGENYTNPSLTPLNIGEYLYQNITSAQGQVSSINGLSSLESVNPTDLTFNFGNLQLLNYDENSSQVTSYFGSNGQQIPYFNLLENNQVIATSNQITLTNTFADATDTSVTQTIDITLNGVTSSPFYQEINQLTNGNNVLVLTGITPNGTADGTAGITGYTFTFNGSATPASSAVPFDIPGGTTIPALGSVLALAVMRKIRKSTSNNFSNTTTEKVN